MTFSRAHHSVWRSGPLISYLPSPFCNSNHTTGDHPDRGKQIPTNNYIKVVETCLHYRYRNTKLAVLLCPRQRHNKHEYCFLVTIKFGEAGKVWRAAADLQVNGGG